MLILTLQADSYAICKLASNDPIPLWAFTGSLCSVTRTLDELSIVCREASVPDDVEREGRWRCLKVEGPLDLSVTGILASLVTPLSEAGISIFSLSTYQTDYVLMKSEMLDRAVEALRAAGHEVR
jgi:uncharacterized protein